MKIFIKNFLIFLIGFLIIAGIFSLFNLPSQKIEEISLDRFIQEINEEEIQSVTLTENKINIILKDGKQQFTYKEPNED